MSGLLYTAIVTPIDVCIVQDKHVWLFILNLTTDLIFTTDLILNFFIAYRSNEDEDGAQWVTDRKAIACHYLKTWFTVDFLSVLPFEIFNFLDMLEGASLVRAVRTIRLLRLVKLLRILRASRIARRWRDFFDISYAHTSILLFALVTAFLVHLMACVWAACGLYWYPTEGLTLEEETTWIEAYGFMPLPRLATHRLYLLSLYVAVVSMFGGVGSITPQKCVPLVPMCTLALVAHTR